MAQYRTGTVALAFGQAEVVGTGTQWGGQVRPGDLLLAGPGDPAVYVAAVLDDTHLLLEQPWPGPSRTASAYAVVRDFEPTTGAPLLAQGDINTHTVFNRAVQRLSVQTAGALAASEAVQQAVAAQAGSQAARDAAAASAAAADGSADAAAAARTAAETAEAGAEAARALADGAAATADTAAGSAAAARDAAQLLRDQASAFRDAAQGFRDEAEDFRDQAQGFVGNSFGAVGDGTTERFQAGGANQTLGLAAGTGIDIAYDPAALSATFSVEPGVLAPAWSAVTAKPTTLAGFGITDAVPASALGAAGGVATLDGAGKLAAAQLPSLAVSETHVVASEAAMLALAAQKGDIAIRTDLGSSGRTYILAGDDPADIGDWTQLAGAGDVLSVFGRTGAVTAQAGDYAASQVGFTPTGALAATTVQGAIDELEAEKLALTGGTVSGTITLSRTDGSPAIKFADLAAPGVVQTVQVGTGTGTAGVSGSTITGGNSALYILGAGATQSPTLFHLGGVSIKAGRRDETGSSLGADVQLRGGEGVGAGMQGGGVRLFGGSAADGNGGSVTLTAWAGVGTNRSGGGIGIQSGAATGTGSGGSVSLVAGASSGGTGGAVNITAGNGGTGGVNGNIVIKAGQSADAAVGNGSVVLDVGPMPLFSAVFFRQAGANFAAMNSESFSPETSGTMRLGASSNRFSTVYGVNADLSGTLTLSRTDGAAAIKGADNGSGGGYATVIQAGTGTGAASATNGNGAVFIYGGGTASLPMTAGARGGVSIKAGTRDDVAGFGGLVRIYGGDGTLPGAGGGAVFLTGGRAVDGNGGGISLLGANGVGTDRNGGNVTTTAGAATGTGTGGNVAATAGASPSGAGGSVSLTAGASGGAAAGGAASLTAGNATGTGAGGATFIRGGHGTDGVGGDVYVSSGNSTNNNAGNVGIAGGSATTGTGLGGYLFLNAGHSVSNQGGGLYATAGNGHLGGNISLVAGNGTGHVGGEVIITAGNSTANAAGDVTITSGSGTGTPAGKVTIQTGTGTGEDIHVSNRTVGNILLSTDDTWRWSVKGSQSGMAGALAPEADNAYDIGHADWRVRKVYSADADFSGTITLSRTDGSPALKFADIAAPGVMQIIQAGTGTGTAGVSSGTITGGNGFVQILGPGAISEVANISRLGGIVIKGGRRDEAGTATGGAVSVIGGESTGTGTGGGNVSITGGIPTDGNGGNVSMSGRAGVGTNRNGGTASINGGAATGTGTGGAVNITAGNSPDSGGGNVNITAGSSTTGTPGFVWIMTGTGVGSVEMNLRNRTTGGVNLWTDNTIRWMVTGSGFGSAGALVPYADNSYAIGDGSYRPSVIYAATGSINTSDIRAKTDIAPLSLGIDFVQAVNPISYRFIEGHKRVVGHNVVGQTVVGQDPETGENILQDVTEPVYESVPGTRTHFGFAAQEVRAALGGDQFAAWTLDDPSDPDSRQGLRPDQLVPILWKAVQELSAQILVQAGRIDALAGQVASTKGKTD